MLTAICTTIWKREEMETHHSHWFVVTLQCPWAMAVVTPYPHVEEVP